MQTTKNTSAAPDALWRRRIETFAAMHGPFETRWDWTRKYEHNLPGLLAVYTIGWLERPDIIPIAQKPACACCGSSRPMFMRILVDRNREKHLVGQECYNALCEMNQVTEQSTPGYNYQRKLCRDCIHWKTTAPWQGKCTIYRDEGRWSESAEPYHNCTRYTTKKGEDK